MTKGQVRPLDLGKRREWGHQGALSREAAEWSGYTGLARLCMHLRDGAIDEADKISKLAPGLAKFYEGAAFAWEMMWRLHKEQADTKAGDIGPEDYAEALAGPMLAVMKGQSATAKAAYKLAMEDASKIAAGWDDEEPTSGKEVASDDGEGTA